MGNQTALLPDAPAVAAGVAAVSVVPAAASLPAGSSFFFFSAPALLSASLALRQAPEATFLTFALAASLASPNRLLRPQGKA